MTTVTIKALVFALWVYIGAFLAPISHFLFFTVALVLCDLFTGVWAARTRKEVIHSKGFKRSVLKISLYFVAILLSEGMKRVFFPDLDFDLVYIVAGIISLTEFKSNLENVATVTGTNIWSLIANYIPRLPKLPK